MTSGHKGGNETRRRSSSSSSNLIFRRRTLTRREREKGFPLSSLAAAMMPLSFFFAPGFFPGVNPLFFPFLR